MNLTIELPDDLGAAVKARAHAEGVSPDRFVSRVLEDTFAEEIHHPSPGRKPLKTGYGSWATQGTAPSAEDIDENRREMFRNFAQDI
ncbi:MAG: hypothetical protein ABJC09_13270 [Terriglobia bacterium]